ncbi:TPA: hypothetical protein N0F65_001295 [Lagenidium giganteum]|uniref:Uncharacterized protein n=1 Tax=Lagenidium giganteum TaxID=4803 RepID=A0AAV2Z2S3_9STRA|nr:TPA: hypothetical protein N0F65_001295 [Lagenidium giganteum]
MQFRSLPKDLVTKLGTLPRIIPNCSQLS